MGAKKKRKRKKKKNIEQHNQLAKALRHVFLLYDEWDGMCDPGWEWLARQKRFRKLVKSLAQHDPTLSAFRVNLKKIAEEAGRVTEKVKPKLEKPKLEKPKQPGFAVALSQRALGPGSG